MNPDWIKIFFNCELDKYSIPSKIKELFFTEPTISKKAFLDRMLESNPNFNYNQMYFEFRRMIAAGWIIELPKKEVGIVKEKIEEAKKEWENDTKR